MSGRARQLSLLTTPVAVTPRQKLMHVCDAGADRMVLFSCARCQHRSDWMQMDKARARRGIPCPKCNPLR
jgi:DNA-directed RNA polymerase subunit RPC12/RpoP